MRGLTLAGDERDEEPVSLLSFGWDVLPDWFAEELSAVLVCEGGRVNQEALEGGGRLVWRIGSQHQAALELDDLRGWLDASGKDQCVCCTIERVRGGAGFIAADLDVE